MSEKEQMHFVYYINNRVLNFRVSDGRTGAEPVWGELGETITEIITRLKVQMGLPESCTFEHIR